MLIPDKIRFENGVKICEKIIPDDAVASKYVAPWVPKGGKMKPGGIMNPIGITIHNTNDLKNVYDDAEQYTRATYPNCNMAGAVVHYYIDDVGAWQNLRENEPGWHASDGNGDGNRRTIAIECIMDGSGSAEDLKARDNAARLIASIIKRHNWDLSNLYTHNHWMKLPDKIVSGARKNCPVFLLSTYDDFKKLIQTYLTSLEGNSSSEEAEVTNSSNLKYEDIIVGNIYNFTGSLQYKSSMNNIKPSKAIPGLVKVTHKTKSNYPNPIHVRSVDSLRKFIPGVYGWVKLEDLSLGSSSLPYKVKVVSSALNCRKGPGTSYPVTTVIKDRGIYTIVEENNGWGKLKSGAGWIYLSYTDKL